jgi:hypothetical protein
MKTFRYKHPSQSDLLFERCWGHPLLGYGVIVAGAVAVLLLSWFDATIHQAAATWGRWHLELHCCSPLRGGSPDAAVD